MGFKENLKAELEYQGLQLKELAEKCGVSKNTLGNYLSGHNSLPSVETGVKIANALGVSVEYLVTGETESSFSDTPIKYRKIIESIYVMDDRDLETISALVESLKKKYPVPKLTKNIFVKKLKDIFADETKKSHTEIIITSGELHRLVGGYPGTNHRMPICCAAMKEAFNSSTDTILSSPTSGNGASLKIRYALPRFD